MFYQPILIENTPSGRDLREEVRSMAEAAGCRLFTRFDQISELGLAEKGVALLAAADLRGFTQSAVMGIPPGCQVIIWSTGRATDLPQEMQSWISRGLRYQIPRVDPSLLAAQEAVVSMMERCFERPGRVYNPVIFVASPEDADRLATEIGIRIQAAGLKPDSIAGPIDTSRWGARQAPPHGSALVVRVTDYDPETRERDGAFVFALEQALAVPVQTVLVVDPETEARMERVESWRAYLERGAVVKVTQEFAHAQTIEHTDDEYPVLRFVLAGRPPQAERRQTVFEGTVSKIPLGEALQFVSNMGHTGRLVVFTHHQVAFIDMQGGKIVHVGPSDRWTRVIDQAEARGIDLQDGDALRALAEQAIEERVVEISEWTEARFAFISRDADPPLDEAVSLDPQGVMMTIARRQDEWPHLARRVGGTARVFMPVRDNTPADVGLVHRVWSTLDGQMTLGEACRRLGVSKFEIAEAVETLIRGNHIMFVRDLPSEEQGSEESVATVVRTLWSEGLVTEAAEIAIAGEEAYSSSMSLAYHLGWIHADRGDWELAVEAFERARESHDGSRRLAAALNSALISVRYLGMEPEDALARVQESGVIDAALGKGERSESNLAAGAAEIALRARDYGLAATLIERVSSVDIRRTLSGCLDRL